MIAGPIANTLVIFEKTKTVLYVHLMTVCLLAISYMISLHLNFDAELIIAGFAFVYGSKYIVELYLSYMLLEKRKNAEVY